MKKKCFTLAALILITLILGFASAFSQKATWNSMNGPYGKNNGLMIRDIMVDPDGDIYAATYSNGVYLFDQANNEWVSKKTGLSLLSLITYRMVRHPDGTFYLATHNGLFTSNDLGNTWTKSPATEASGDVRSVIVNSKGNIFISKNDGIYRSKDKGTSWEKLSKGLPEFVAYPELTVAQKDVIFAAMSSIDRSEDGGDNWSDLVSAGGGTANCIVTSPEGYVFAGTTAGKMIYTKDNGLTWQVRTINSQGNFSVNALLPISGNLVYAGTERGIFQTTDYGKNWTQDNSGLVDTVIYSLAKDKDGFVLAGSKEKGVYRNKPSETSVREILSTPVDKYYLSQNYPNPVIDNTEIKFLLPEAGYVTIKVYNLLGKEVETILSGLFEAGAYVAGWKNINLQPGTYIYRLETDSFSASKSMIITR